MKVITPYPIIKNGRTVKSGSVTVNSSFDGDDFSFLDGKSPKSEILAFQKYVNNNVDGGSRLTEDGLWGKNTANAWSKFGDSYTKSTTKSEGDYSTLPNIGMGNSTQERQYISDPNKKKVDADSILSGVLKVANTYSDAVKAFKKKGLTPPSEAEFNDAKNKSSKKMSTTVKIAIGVASLALIITIFAIVKKKK